MPSDFTMENSSDLVQVISKCIENCETNKLSSIFEDAGNNESIASNCWDIIPILCAKLDQETYDKLPAMFQSCDKLLNKVAEISCPEEALLELIEQADCPDNDLRFLALLKPIHRLLIRMPEKRGRSLVWCLNLVASHISALPEPSSYTLENSERVLLDLDPATCRAVDVYNSITPFFEPFVEEVSLFKPVVSVDKPILAQQIYQRYVLSAFLIHLLEKPLLLMDLEYDGKTKSKSRCVAEKIVEYFDNVMPDIVPILFERCFGKQKLSNDDGWDTDPVKMFQFEEKVPILGLSNLLYLILVEGLSRKSIPYVYSPNYLFPVALHLSTELLLAGHDLSVWKGLQLAHSSISLVPQSSISYTMLDLPIHKNFCTSLEKIVVYCNIETYRKKGIRILQNYVMIMDLKARYQVFINLFPLLEHSGVKGVLVTMLKDTIRMTMSDIHNPTTKLYRSKSLLKLIEVYCIVPNGPEVDLMDHSDHIISLLNLLWYLALADRSDLLGLWEHAPYLDRYFIHPLKDGLKLSRAHYELKIHQLEEEKMNQTLGKKIKGDFVSVSVQGETVPDLSYDEKKQILNVALNKFSIMESLLSSIREEVESRFASRHSTDS